MKSVMYFLVLFVLLLSPLCYSQKPITGDSPSSPQGDPIRTYLNLNNISTVFKNDGISDIDFSGSNSGFIFPKGSGKAAVFSSGLLWGVKIAGDPQARVGGSAYRTGLQGGKIISPGVAENPSDPHVRIYRVRPDVYPGGPPVDLWNEANDEFKTPEEVRAQYETDWIEWRAIDGAPFDDVDGNGSYNPDIDIPGVKGAIQTIWFVANDLNAVLTNFLYGTDPIGIEMQGTIWEYKNSLFFDNLFYRKYKLINKGTTPFNDMYISMWSDPDIGNAGDDFVGCDTLLNLGYGYNALDSDPTYEPLPPPAVGFDLIQGPLVAGNPGEDKNRNGIDDSYDYGIFERTRKGPGFINLPLTAFYYFTRGDSSVTDPIQGSSEGSTQFYNFMQGRVGITGEPFINPVTGLPTTFTLSGNPVTSEGWIDGIVFGLGDRRLGLSSGPIQMAPGDTQVVVIAEIAAGAVPDVDRLMAIDLLKYYSESAQNFYDNNFNPGEEEFPSHNITTSELGASSVYAVDVDGDGDMDVLSASVAFDKIAWYENDGSENFSAHTITTSADFARSVYAVDVDGDGDMDVLSASSNDDKIAWYENDGNETFITHPITSSAAGASSVYTIDVDGDGDMDVLSASSNDDKIAWYENDGNETFITHPITSSAAGAISVYAVDIDGDGDTDVLSASWGDDKIAWYENDGNENFNSHTITSSAIGASSVYAIDVDSDGDIDVLSASSGQVPSSISSKIAWYENNGNETFTPHTITTTVAWSARSVYAVDIDGDGDMDVLSASANDNKIALYENDGNENFTPHTITTDAEIAISVYAIDVDGDGDIDVLSASSNDGKIAWYENLSPPVGIEATSNEIPIEFTLSQNYPNPFNPSTTIKFSLPSSGYATLYIYNALGEEVAVLLDKELTTGSYEVEWNAIGLPSGVYFYQLKSEGYVETKKMVLLR